MARGGGGGVRLDDFGPPQAITTGRYGSGRSALRVFGCGWVADGCFRHVIQAIHRLPIRTRHEVPVGVYGELDRRVTELVTHIGERLSPDPWTPGAASMAMCTSTMMLAADPIILESRKEISMGDSKEPRPMPSSDHIPLGLTEALGAQVFSDGEVKGVRVVDSSGQRLVADLRDDGSVFVRIEGKGIPGGTDELTACRRAAEPRQHSVGRARSKAKG